MKKKDTTTCLNCEKSYDANYNFCPYCGQANRPNDLNLKFVVSEFLSANFNIDSRFFHSIKMLLFRPAFLTHEFLAGKRTKYTTPIRLYLIISLVYFFLLSVVPVEQVQVKNKGPAVISGSQKSLKNGVSTEQMPAVDTLDAFERRIIENAKQLETDRGMSMFWQNERRNFSTGMFVVMPLSALILYLLFFKNTYYYEHLIFMIHLQTVWFIISAVYMLIQRIVHLKVLFLIELLILLWVTFLWFRRFYHTSMVRTLVKMTFFFMMFSVLILFFTVFISLNSLLFL